MREQLLLVALTTLPIVEITIERCLNKHWHHLQHHLMQLEYLKVAFKPTLCTCVNRLQHYFDCHLLEVLNGTNV